MGTAGRYLVASIVALLTFTGCSTDDAPPHDAAPATETGVPGWYDTNRVHAHTRLGPFGHLSDLQGQGGLDTRVFENGSRLVAELGPQVIVRHVKSRDEDPWWPSLFPPSVEGPSRYDHERSNQGMRVAAGRDVAREIITETHEAGLAMIAYYWHSSEATLADEHPEWVCRDSRGDTETHFAGRGDYLDITGPYGDIVAGRLAEVAEAGADGFYFDGRHAPREGCWGTALERVFLQATGLAGPAEVARSGESTHRWLRFNAEALADTFDGWLAHVRRDHPEVVFVVSAPTLDALTSPEISTSLVEQSIAKTEYTSALRRASQMGAFAQVAEPPRQDVRAALGWALLRDASSGRPPHVWIHEAADQQHLLTSIAAVVGWGGVANVDVREESLVSARDVPQGIARSAVEAGFRLNDLLRPAMGGARPLRWAGVHFPEDARNARGADYGAAWREVLWPFHAGFEALVRARVPAGVVTDEQLRRGALDGYDLIFLPAPAELTDEQLSSVRAFEEAGGTVMEHDALLAWGDAARTPANMASLARAFEAHLEGAPVRVEGGPPGLHAVPHVAPEEEGKRRLTVALLDDFSWTLRDDAGPVGRDAPNAQEAVDIVVRPHRGTTEESLPEGDVSARDALSGEEVPVRQTPDGYVVSLDGFADYAFVVIEEG